MNARCKRYRYVENWRDSQSRETDAGEKIADRKTNTFHNFLLAM